MKQGDLVSSKETHELWIVLNVTHSKKTWHRVITLFKMGQTMKVSWKERQKFEVISESR